MRRLWLIFAQTVTVSLAVLFVVSTLKPEWLGKPVGAGTNVVALRESPLGAGDPATGSASYRDAAQKALPSVVHVFTSQKIRAPRHPLIDDPVFRHFFGDSPEPQGQTKSGLGSGVVVSADGYILTNFPRRRRRRPDRSRAARRATRSTRGWSAAIRRPTSPCCRSTRARPARASSRRSPWARWTTSSSATSCWRSAILSASARR